MKQNKFNKALLEAVQQLTKQVRKATELDDQQDLIVLQTTLQDLTYQLPTDDVNAPEEWI